MDIIKDFQLKHGLLVDGIIGKNTLLKIKEVYKIPNIEAVSHFMGQCSHESNDFKSLEENLNYSAKRLMEVFPSYFNQSAALKYQFQPEKIANKVYANRMGNGDEKSGDGWKHRGFGVLQLTGKNNQYDFANYVGDERIKEFPELIAKEYAFESAKYFFDKNSLWKFCNVISDDFILILSKAINLGNPYSKKIPHGMINRIYKTKNFYKILSK